MRSAAFYAWVTLAISRAAFAQASADDSSDVRGRQVAAGPGQKDATVVKEEVAPGTEPQSPSTLGLSIQDPRTVRRSSGALGSVGALHVLSADLGPKGVLRFSALGEYFNTNDFPVRTASDTRSSGTFALSYILLDLLELYASYTASANTNSTSSPHQISSLGDFGAGTKLASRIGGAFYGGLDVHISSYASMGSQSLRGSALGVAPELLATYDLHQASGFPLRLHGNIGALFDNTRTAVASQTLNAAEQYALSINRYHRLILGIAAEVPLPAVSPFFEYNLRYPIGVPGGVFVGPDGVLVPIGKVLPQAVTLGAKITAIKDLTLIAAVDLGLSRMVGLGLPATPPYNILFGAAFNVDLFSRGETRIVEKISPPAPRREAPTTGRVAGVVLDAQTKKPIAAAIVAMIGAGLPPVASDEGSGAFVSHELPAGPVRLGVQKEGYRSWERDLVLQAGRTSRIEIDLEAIPKKARFAINVTSKSRPIAASVVFKGAEEMQVPISGASAEAVKVEASPGKYLVNVTAPGHLAQTREVQASDGPEISLNFDLLPKPKRTLVVIRDNRIDTLQKIHFATGKATILADSFPLLAQLVDAIIKNGIKRVRIEGHTDNRGKQKTNLHLSAQRAQAVADYLEHSGIRRSRLETEGFGDSRPIAPNLTARGRELNRRVELIILDQ